MAANTNGFIELRMKKSGRLIPARLQAALALLEKLRDSPSLDLDDHKRRNSSGLNSHETYGNRAHERHQLTALNKNHGPDPATLEDGGKSFSICFERTDSKLRRRSGRNRF